MEALDTRIGVFLIWLALSTGACSDRSAPESVGGSAEASGAGAAGWTLVQTADFNHDGLQDVLWNERGTNHQIVWLMRGTGVLEAGPEIPGPLGDGWIAATAGDFNFDGMADVHWYNAGTNRMAMWLMNGAGIRELGPEIPGPLGGGWIAATAGDFNLDGMADLLWYNPASNRAAVWLIEGTGVLAQGPEMPGPAGTGWTAVTGADFNLDGMADVLWYNPTTNRMAVWLMNGTALLAPGPEIPGPPGDGWNAITAADFNRDGMADVIWHNPTTNRMAVWLMNGTALLAPGPEIPGPRGDDWKIAYAGDMDGDGLADAVWVNTSLKAMAVWTMNGTRVLTQGAVLPGPE
jgi:hypothetical protein